MKKTIALIIVLSVLFGAMQTNVFAAGTGPDAQYEKRMEYFEENDFDSAFSYFQISGEIKSYAPSQNMLGVCYRDGLGTEQNLGEAEKYFSLSADQGYPPAQENLTALYEKKEGERSNAYQEAMNLLFEGKYEEAKSAFEALGDYERSADFVGMCENLMQGNNRAAGVENLKVGDYVEFGSYEQDNDLSNGKEPIEWLVLDQQNNKVLLISRYALDCQKYNASYKTVTWEMCSLREWLNNNFLKKAFDSVEQSKILTTTISADKNPTYNSDPGKATQDKVFLLSITEANQYFTSFKELKCIGTAYSNGRGAMVNSTGNCSWWLRTPGRNYTEIKSPHAVSVNSAGFIGNSGNEVSSLYIAIRPAMWINLDS